MRLQGRIALITGGASGIGHAVATRFASESANVVIADLDEGKAKEAAAALNAQAFALDVRDQDAVEELVGRVENEIGPIDALVTCAGVGTHGGILETTLEDWQRILDINLTGTFITAQAVARRMVMRGTGSIVMIGSINSRRPVAMRHAYAVSKAGVLSLMQVMAMELGPKGMRINALAPGPIETPMVKAMHTAAVREAYAVRVPQRRYGTPAEVAAAALFLCSDDASYVNGHMLDVDGGFDAVGMVLPED